MFNVHFSKCNLRFLYLFFFSSVFTIFLEQFSFASSFLWFLVCFFFSVPPPFLLSCWCWNNVNNVSWIAATLYCNLGYSEYNGFFCQLNAKHFTTIRWLFSSSVIRKQRVPRNGEIWVAQTTETTIDGKLFYFGLIDETREREAVEEIRRL